MSLSRTALLVALLAAGPTLHASPITYQMTFTSGGSAPAPAPSRSPPKPSSSGTTSDTLANQQLQALTFTVAGQTFDFSGDPTASVQFVNGQITKINFSQAMPAKCPPPTPSNSPTASPSTAAT